MQWHSPQANATREAAVQYHITDSGRSLTALVNGQHIDLCAPVQLAPVRIDKPWGQEIWFTGMEARGEAMVTVDGQQLPLPQYLALAPAWLHQAQPIVLLKILDPKPEPVLGDLYLEVHEHKEETYVVTAVDRSAWPDGVGAIRYGVNQAHRHSHIDDAQFRSAYLHAVQRYESVRRVLDGELDPSTCNDPELLQDSRALADLERSRRADMDQFTNALPLQVGDVVSVPPWQPHSLQHGVQVVEFQSPTYERFIISFAQQVQTQPHWDSALAIARMSLEPRSPTPEADSTLPDGVQRIACYAGFGALRVQLEIGQSAYQIPRGLPYAVLICIAGRATCGPTTLAKGDACFVPALGLSGGLSIAPQAANTLILIAAPGL